MHVRRPSAAMTVSLVALFASLGGVGYAATTLPSGSVGTAQLQTGAVSNAKIKNGAVGHGKLASGAVGKTQINSSQVQARVSGTCAARGIASVTSTGGVTCASAGAEFDTSSASPVTVTPGKSAATVASESLDGGSSYLVFANPDVRITDASDHQQVQVTCTLAVGTTTAAQQTRTWSTEIGAEAYNQENAIPLVVTAPSSSNSITANVTCTSTYDGGLAPTVTVTSNINALETASNTTATQQSGSSG